MGKTKSKAPKKTNKKIKYSSWDILTPAEAKDMKQVSSWVLEALSL